MSILTAVRLQCVKRYEFTNPVFFPDTLKRKGFLIPGRNSTDFSFLGDGETLRQMIGKKKKRKVEIPNFGIIEPIRNPRAPAEPFWLPFAKKPTGLKLKVRPEVPIFPFHVIPTEYKLKADRDWLEDRIRRPFTEATVDWGIRIYPPGICTVYIDIMLVNHKKPFTLESITGLRNLLRYIPFEVKEGTQFYDLKGIFQAFDWLFSRFCETVVKGETDYIYPGEGYYIFYNLQGSDITLEDDGETLASLLLLNDRSVPAIKPLMLRGESDADILAIGRKTAIVAIDEGVYDLHRDIINYILTRGRRCFFWQFVFSVEFAYITKPLVRLYEEHFTDLLTDLEVLRLGSSWKAIMDKYTRRSIMDPCVYGTLQREILTIPKRLRRSRRDGFWEEVYAQAARNFGVAAPLRELNRVAAAAYKEAVMYKSEYAERIADVMKGTKAAVETILDVIKTVRPGL